MRKSTQETNCDVPQSLVESLKSLAPHAVFRGAANMVIRAVRNRDGRKIGTIMRTFDGTKEGMIRAAEEIRAEMFAEYPDACNVESRIGARDSKGRYWAISPNHQHIAEIGTAEARYIFGAPVERVKAESIETNSQ